jgi:uncharacterized protein (TIGR03086 family)
MNTIPLDTDLAAQFRAEADRTFAAWTAHGLDGEMNIGAGPMPAPACMSVNLIDTATHSWDIAHATGQDGNLPDELAATILAIAQGFVSDAIRGFAGFDPPVPVAGDAGPTDQLVAFLGRRP